MRLLDTRFDGPPLREPTAHGVARGLFVASYRENIWAAPRGGHVGQDNHSRSGVVCGMHFSIGAGPANSCVARAGGSLTSSSTCVGLPDIGGCESIAPNNIDLPVSQRDAHAPLLGMIAAGLGF